MKMKVCRNWSHQTAGARIRCVARCHSLVRMILRCRSLAGAFQLILQIQDDKVAGPDSQSGRLRPMVVDVAISHRPVGLGLIVIGQVNSEDPIMAPKIFWLRDNAPLGRSRTDVFPRPLRPETRMPRTEAENQERKSSDVLEAQEYSAVSPGRPSRACTFRKPSSA